MRVYLRLIERWRYRLLLAILLAVILLQPLLQDVLLGQAIIIFAYGAILAGGVHVTRPQPWMSALFAWLAITLVGLSWYSLFWVPNDLTVGLAMVIVTFLFGAFAASRILVVLLSEPAADADALAGAVFGYFLLVMVWALLFQALELWSPGAFSFAADGGSLTEFLYFSLVTITTLGYGDISPVAPFARISAGLEAAIGTLYIAILMARIVGALGGRRE